MVYLSYKLFIKVYIIGDKVKIIEKIIRVLLENLVFKNFLYISAHIN